jgi:hypothetical protein
MRSVRSVNLLGHQQAIPGEAIQRQQVGRETHQHQSSPERPDQERQARPRSFSVTAGKGALEQCGAVRPKTVVMAFKEGQM